MSSPRKPPKIVTRFAYHLSHVVANYLTDPSVNEHRQPVKDRLAVKLILLLGSERYRRELLFCDYAEDPGKLWIDKLLGADRPVYIEAVTYAQDVLNKRVEIISTHQAKPTNIHKLLLMLCRYSLEPQWSGTRIKRRKEQQPICGGFFQPMADILARQCKAMKIVGPVAKTFRQRFGLLFLIAGTYQALLPEEMSLFDVVEAAPAPLKPSLRLAAWYRPLMERILVTLNEEYGLLRSCGLPPRLWIGCFSIGKLRDLYALHDRVETLLKTDGERLAQTKQNPAHAAYEEVLTGLLEKKGTWAGFESVADFVLSEVGIALLNNKISFDGDPADEADSDPAPSEKITAPPIDTAELQLGLERLQLDNPESFSPLTAYFFTETIVRQRPVQGADGVLADEAFQVLLSADAGFADLDAEKQVEKLIRKMTQIIQKHSRIVDADTWLESY